MDQFRRALANIQQSMGQLGATHKLLFGSLAVIAAMTLFLVSQYAGKPKLVDLMSESGDAQLVQTLNAAGINAQSEGGRVMVPPDQRHAAAAILLQSGQMPGDTKVLFDNLLASQDWKSSREQQRQQTNIAYQNELARVISEFRGVRKATVILDIPEASGLGRAVREPSASVTVFTTTGQPVPQATVDAVANCVVGARSGLSRDRVQVIDGTTGVPCVVSDEESISAGRYLDHKKEVERYTQHEIERLLGYIPGVVVSVNAVVDVTRVARTQQKYLPKGDGTVSLPTSVNNTEDTMTQGSRGAEAGLRSTSTADISTGSNSRGSESSKTSETSQFDVRVGSETTETVDPRGMPTRLSASVFVPQSFIEGLVRGARPDDQKDQPVTQADADAYFQTMSPVLQKAVLTKLETVDDAGQPRQGSVMVAMAPMPAGVAGGISQAGFFGAGGGGGGGGGIGGLFSASNMIEMVVLGVLAFVAVGMMFSMVRRAGRKSDLPTAEELVGVPPALEVAGDLVGEADESDAPMAGIEISEDEVKIQKMREQVSELITTNPEAAAALVGRWISEDEM